MSRVFYSKAALSKAPLIYRVILDRFGPDARLYYLDPPEPLEYNSPQIHGFQDHNQQRREYRQQCQKRLLKHLDKGQALAMLEGLKHDPEADQLRE